jgi:hypothetical protein
MTPTHEQLWKFTPKTMQRLWSKIEMQPGEMDCWLWTGATQDGYGQIYITIDGKRSAVPVHRVMLVLCYAGISRPSARLRVTSSVGIAPAATQGTY